MGSSGLSGLTIRATIRPASSRDGMVRPGNEAIAELSPVVDEEARDAPSMRSRPNRSARSAAISSRPRLGMLA